MKVTQIEKLNQLISRTDITGNQKVEWLTNFIDEHVTEQLRLNDVSNRREQLILFAQFVQNDYYGNGIEHAEIIVDRWLNREKN